MNDVYYAINFEEKLAMINDEIIPIVYWSKEGDSDCKLREAWKCVAGPTKKGKYFVIDLIGQTPVLSN